MSSERGYIECGDRVGWIWSDVWGEVMSDEIRSAEEMRRGEER